MTKQKIKTTINMPKRLSKEIQDHMYKEGYNLRQKSIWICEALTEFLDKKRNEHQVIAATQVQRKTENITLYLEQGLSDRLKKSALELKSKSVQLKGVKGVKSLIVIASIVHRLFVYDEKN
jgi:hypothetical protein